MNSNPDGTFFFDQLSAGRYQVRVDTNGATFVRSIRQAGHDVPADGMLVGDTELEPLEIVISAGSATVQGSVELPGANLDEGVDVAFPREAGGSLVLQREMFAVLPKAFRQRNETPATALNSAVTANRFTEVHAEGMPAGDYLVFAWLGDFGVAKDLPYNTPEFLKRFGWAGEGISIGESETRRLTIRNALPWDAFGLN